MIQRFIILHLLFISDIYEKSKETPYTNSNLRTEEPKENKGLVPYVYAQPPITPKRTQRTEEVKVKKSGLQCSDVWTGCPAASAVIFPRHLAHHMGPVTVSHVHMGPCRLVCHHHREEREEATDA
jgi:hypothetical protein